MKVGAYPAARQALLQRISTALAADERFPAAWLAGSFGRGEADGFSDLDLCVVIAQAYSPALCARPVMVAAGTIPERYALFSRFGEPVVIHENHHNASGGGTFTFVLYREKAQIVDWTLLPQDQAFRPPQSVLLYDRAGILIQPPPAPEALAQRVEMVTERAAFFWMVAASTARMLHRSDRTAFYGLLGMLYEALEEVKRLVAGQPKEYRRRPPLPPADTIREQMAILRKMFAEMESLRPSILAMGGRAPDQPGETIDILLDLAEDK